MFKKLFIWPIKLYQLTLSPMLGANCRFTPSCSQYMVDAIEEWGPIKGIWMGLRRISRCHPWGGHGHDPVPKKSKSTKG
jgi:putative membrane protein insertion efficiency factor